MERAGQTRCPCSLISWTPLLTLMGNDMVLLALSALRWYKWDQSFWGWAPVRGGVPGRDPMAAPAYRNFCFFSAGLRIYTTHPLLREITEKTPAMGTFGQQQAQPYFQRSCRDTVALTFSRRDVLCLLLLGSPASCTPCSMPVSVEPLTRCESDHTRPNLAGYAGLISNPQRCSARCQTHVSL